MYFTADRFEGDYAVLENENGKSFAVPIQMIPGLREGDILRITIENNSDTAEKRKENISRLQKKLFRE